MHNMLKRAAASAVPALIGLAVFPATAMAAPHTGPLIGGAAHGVILHGKVAVLHNHVFSDGAPGINNSVGTTAGNGIVGITGNSTTGRAAAAGRP